MTNLAQYNPQATQVLSICNMIKKQVLWRKSILVQLAVSWVLVLYIQCDILMLSSPSANFLCSYKLSDKFRMNLSWIFWRVNARDITKCQGLYVNSSWISPGEISGTPRDIEMKSRRYMWYIMQDITNCSRRQGIYVEASQ